jgi:hypothetical protein
MADSDLPRAVPMFGPPADLECVWLRLGGTRGYWGRHPGSGFLYVTPPKNTPPRITSYSYRWGHLSGPHQLLELDAVARQQTEYSALGGVAQLFVLDPYGGAWVAALEGPVGGEDIMNAAGRIRYWQTDPKARLTEAGYAQLHQIPLSEATELGLLTDPKDAMDLVKDDESIGIKQRIFEVATEMRPQTSSLSRLPEEDYPTLLARWLGEDFVAALRQQQLPPSQAPNSHRAAPPGTPRPPGAREASTRTPHPPRGQGHSDGSRQNRGP